MANRRDFLKRISLTMAASSVPFVQAANNLAQSPEHQKTLKKLQSLLDEWIADTKDKGLARMRTSHE